MWKNPAWLLLLLCLAGCSPEPSQSQLYQIYQRDSLKVGILHGPTSYYVGIDGPTGFELELSQALADKLEVKLELYPSYHLDELLQKLETGQVDYIAGGLTQTELRKSKYRASPAYRWINEVLVFKQGNVWPRTLDELSDQVIVVKDSSHAETLRQLSLDNPDLQWQQHPTLDADEILQQVVDGNIAYTLTDSNQLALNRRFYPNLSIAFTVRDNLPVSWLLAALPWPSMAAVPVRAKHRAKHRANSVPWKETVCVMIFECVHLASTACRWQLVRWSLTIPAACMKA